MPLNPVDLLLIAIVLVGALTGWLRGFVFSALDLLTLAVSLVAAFLGYREVTNLAARVAASPGIWVAPVSFVAIFLLVHIVLGMAILRLAWRMPQAVHRNLANKLLGVLPGLVNGAMHAVVAAVLLLTAPLGARIGTWAQDSALAPRFAAPAEWVEAQLAPVFDPAVRRLTQALTVKPDSHQIVPLPFRTPQAQPRPDLESQMFVMVNAERRAAGLKPVVPDSALTEVARAHSHDMLARGYFSHHSPEGKDLTDRLRQAQVSYLAAGENLALAPTLYTAHNGLMHSPGHRANILRGQFGRLGIGILDSGGHGLMVTQAFRN